MAVQKPTPEDILKALLHDEDIPDPLEELIATGEAICNMIRISEMDHLAKDAFYQLERQFGFYARLTQLCIDKR
ncbi:MAG: hypothetical protein NTW29_20395 [Bacteroidetes bacterium]|nr:hypothetical protein [Bacteroidota bacterium]